MPRKKWSFLSLKRGRLRQSWSKYNLYNLSRAKNPVLRSMTHFQQKWAAKAATRSYHGETVLEKHWQRQFSPVLRSVATMNAKTMAENDGSEQAAGRGMGLEYADEQDVKQKLKPRVPYMNMVYAPLERRLDTAIHRALFASSTRQARQFVIHGYVKVNGKKMIYPGYQLNPGDMFQVEPDRVLYATGAPKTKEDRRAGRKLKNMKKKEQAEAVDESQASEEAGNTKPEPIAANTRDTLKLLLESARDLLATEKDEAGAKRKRGLRELSRLVRREISKTGKGTTTTDSVNEQMSALMQQLGITENASDAENARGKSIHAADSAGDKDVELSVRQKTLTSAQKAALEQALEELRQNPIDPSKPYATPWSPREYMSPFAFIPRYLEVHHKICSAVYLRHPVARWNLAEVATPFNTEMNGLAFNWYLRRR